MIRMSIQLRSTLWLVFFLVGLGVEQAGAAAVATRQEWMTRLPDSVQLRPLGETLHIHGRPTKVWLIESALSLQKLVQEISAALKDDVLVGKLGEQVQISQLSESALTVVGLRPQGRQVTGYVAISTPVYSHGDQVTPDWVPRQAKVLSSIQSIESGWHLSQWVLQAKWSMGSLVDDIQNNLGRAGWRLANDSVESRPQLLRMNHPLNEGELTLFVTREEELVNAVVEIRRKASFPGIFR